MLFRFCPLIFCVGGVVTYPLCDTMLGALLTLAFNPFTIPFAAPIAPDAILLGIGGVGGC